MDLHRTYPVDTVVYKGKPLIECTNEELILASKWVNKRIPAMVQEIKHRVEFALEFAKVLPETGGREIIKTAVSLTGLLDEYKFQAEQIKKVIEGRRGGN